ncbi:MAG TPA: glycosyltransferase, partial [Candidatus Atribacteria bacterium]|nr:glycosyltransferase [Candidatus Atribacteria bacterium]
VEFGGSIPNKDLPIELNKSEIFILPSFFEGNPKALLEAMSCGLACIGTDVEGIREVIKHKENGYLCKTDPKSIKEAILEILNDRELETKISQNARKAILENFSLEKILEKEIKIYQSL